MTKPTFDIDAALRGFGAYVKSLAIHLPRIEVHLLGNRGYYKTTSPHPTTSLVSCNSSQLICYPAFLSSKLSFFSVRIPENHPPWRPFSRGAVFVCQGRRDQRPAVLQCSGQTPLNIPALPAPDMRIRRDHRAPV